MGHCPFVWASMLKIKLVLLLMLLLPPAHPVSADSSQKKPAATEIHSPVPAPALVKPLKPLKPTKFKKIAPAKPIQPKAPPAPAPAASGSIVSMIHYWARHYGNDPAFMVRIATCESTLGADLVNESYSVWSKHLQRSDNPTGVYQFIADTYIDFAGRAGLPARDDRLNHARNIQLANWAFKHGLSSHWECK